MGRIRKRAARKAAPPEVDQKIQEEERQRIAERLVRALRKVGYLCSLEDNSIARTSRRQLTLKRQSRLSRC
jgi:hypothetical protein